MKLPLYVFSFLLILLGYTTSTTVLRHNKNNGFSAPPPGVSSSTTSETEALTNNEKLSEDRNVWDTSLYSSSLWQTGTSWFRRVLGGKKTTIYITIWDVDECDHDEEGRGGGKGGGSSSDEKCKEKDHDKEEEEEEEDDEETTTVPDHLQACSDEGGIDSDASSTTVSWNFWVETSTDDTADATENVCYVMSTLVKEDIDANHCASSSSKRQLREEKFHRRQRRLAIQGYEKADITCTFVGSCVPTNEEESKSCGIYKAGLDVVYNDEGEDNTSASEVSRTVTSVAEDVVTADDFGSQVGDDEVTFVGFGIPETEGDPTVGLSGQTYEDSSQGLTRAGKMAVAFASTLLALLLLLCYFCWRRNRNRDSDSKSIDTDLETATMPGRGYGGAGGSIGSDDDDDMSYRTSDYNNLALHHSKLDVHRCTSSTCEVCNPPNSTGQVPGVFFIGSRGGAPLSDIVEEEMKSSSGVSDGDNNNKGDNEEQEENEYEDDTDIPPPPPPPLPDAANDDGEDEQPVEEKKGLFSRFSRKKTVTTPTPEPEADDPIVRSRETETAGSDEVEMEI